MLAYLDIPNSYYRNFFKFILKILIFVSNILS